MCARRWPTDERRRLGSRKATTVLPEVPESTTPCRQVLTRSRRVAAGRGSRRDVPGIGPHRSSHPDQVDGRPAGCSFAHSLLRSFAHSSGEAAITAWQPSRMQGQPLIPTMAAHMCPHCHGPSSRLRPLRASSASPRRATA